MFNRDAHDHPLFHAGMNVVGIGAVLGAGYYTYKRPEQALAHARRAASWMVDRTGHGIGWAGGQIYTHSHLADRAADAAGRGVMSLGNTLRRFARGF